MMGLTWVVTTVVVILLIRGTNTQALIDFETPGDEQFFQFSQQIDFILAWPDSSQPLSFQLNGGRDALLVISPVPHLVGGPHYIIALNAATGCEPTRSHAIARDFWCRVAVGSTGAPILAAGQDVPFTITYASNLLEITVDGATSPLISFQDVETICNCCYIGVYSWFGEDVTWRFPDDLPRSIDLSGKTTLQSTTLGDDGSSKAIDGNEDTNAVTGDSCAITMAEVQNDADAIGPYWRLDLGDEYEIDTVVIYDAPPVPASLEIYVGSCDHSGDTDYNGRTPGITDNNVCGDGTIDIAEAVQYGSVQEKCSPPGGTKIGRYVYIHLPETGNGNPDQTLTLCEVKVFGKVATYGSGIPVITFSEGDVNIPEDIPNQLIPMTISNGLDPGPPIADPPTCFSFGVTTVDGTAQAGNTADYTAIAQTFDFIPGDAPQLTYDLPIPIHNDIICEENEAFTIQFTDVTGVNVGSYNNAVNVNIQDDDGYFTFIQSDYTVSEPSRRPLIHKWVNITVNFECGEGVLPSYVTGSVRFDTIPIVAQPIIDFELYTNHLVEFAPGVTSINIPVGITDDDETELSETFRVTLSEPSDNFRLGDLAEAVVTILDSDHSCSLSQSTYGVLESQGQLEIEITCHEILQAGTSVEIRTNSLSAQTGVDYIVRKHRVDFDGSALSGSFLIDILDDAILEMTEIFHVLLVNGNGVLIDGDNIINEAEVSIADNDASYSVRLSAERVGEGDAYMKVYAFITRSGFNQQDGSVWLRTKVEDTENASPADANDFIAVNEVVNFGVGDSEKVVEIQIIDDDVPEASIESFLVELYNPINGVLGDDISEEVFILDNDETSDQLYYLEQSEYDVLESDDEVEVLVYRTEGGNTGKVTLSTGSFSDGALPDIDYVDQHTDVEFDVGERSKSVRFQILGDDNILEYPKKFHVGLFFPVDGRIGSPRSATINIIDDDVAVTFVEAKYGAFEDSGILSIPVKRTGYMGVVSIGINSEELRGGRATSGEDFSVPDTVTFASGEDTVYIPVTIINDVDNEAETESLVLELNPGSRGSVVGLAQTTVVIFDNDVEVEEEDDGKLGTLTIALIGLGAGFGLLALIALIACMCLCTRAIMSPNATALAKPSPYLYPAYPGEPLPGPPPYRARQGPYLT